jgi:hypothetical protein
MRVDRSTGGCRGRPGGGGERRGAARSCRRARGSGAVRRPTATHRVRARPLCSPLACARRARPHRRSLRGRVQRALTPLRAEGWRLRHSLRWQGGGDIDSVAISPTGIAVAIETKTRTSRVDISLGCAIKRPGYHGAGDGGHAMASLASCAWSALEVSSALT